MERGLNLDKESRMSRDKKEIKLPCIEDLYLEPSILKSKELADFYVKTTIVRTNIKPLLKGVLKNCRNNSILRGWYIESVNYTC